jgi:hypothetical protein
MSEDERHASMLKRLTEEWPTLSRSAKRARMSGLSCIIAKEGLEQQFGEDFDGLNQESQIKALKDLLSRALSRIGKLEADLEAAQSEFINYCNKETELQSDISRLSRKEAQLESKLDAMQNKYDSDMDTMKKALETINRELFTKKAKLVAGELVSRLLKHFTLEKVEDMRRLLDPTQSESLVAMAAMVRDIRNFEAHEPDNALTWPGVYLLLKDYHPLGSSDDFWALINTIKDFLYQENKLPFDSRMTSKKH